MVDIRKLVTICKQYIYNTEVFFTLRQKVKEVFRPVQQFLYLLNFQEFQEILGRTKGTIGGKFFWWTPEKESYDNKEVHKSSGYYLTMLFVMYALLQKKNKKKVKFFA